MAGGGEKDAKAGSSEERTTERKLVASAVMQAADSTRDVASEDFLFHLYRGSELLQDNRVLEAKEELEQALTLQPRDPKGQDLLAVVYFRIGHYPRAIQIYEQLKRDNPRDPALKLNLALCYLKTGQAQPARAELEDVVRLNPGHKRAWGYLGLAYERLGDLVKAQTAFERSGHTQMTRRVAEKLALRAAAAVGGGTSAVDAEVRGAAAAAFEELDAGEVAFSLAEPITGSQQSGTWRAVEPGAADRTPTPVRKRSDGWTVPPSAEAVASMRAEEIAAQSENETPLPSPPGMPGWQAVPMPLAHLMRAARLNFPTSPGVLVHASGVALVRTTGGTEGTGARPFAARLDAVRVHGGAPNTEVLARRARGKSTGESLGGVASPLVQFSGAGELVLAPRSSHTLVAFTLAEDSITLREDVLLGFDVAGVAYESGKLAVGDGDSTNVVQLRGTGVVILELLDRLQAVQITESHPMLVRRDGLIGWLGPHVAPRALPPAEAPSGQRGLLSLAGDGTVLVTSG